MFERRLRAYSIDLSFSFVIMFILIIALSNLDNISEQSRWGIVLLGYYLVMIIPHFFSRGQSFGKRTQKIKLIKNTKELVPKEKIAPSLGMIMLRELVKCFLGVFTFGFYLILAGIISSNREDGRTIHDFIFGTRVVALTRYASDSIEFNKVEPVANKIRGSRYDD